MPSPNKPQATLMAMAARNLKVTKKRGARPGGSRNFNNANEQSGMLKKSGGGPAGMMGHAMSGTQLGQADSLIRRAQDSFARFAAGGAVKKPQPKGPSAKERRDIRAIVERGKTDAVSALRETRDALNASKPPDADGALAKISARLSLPRDGEAPAEPSAPDEPSIDDAALDAPALMYQEYVQLMQALENGVLDEPIQMQAIERLAQLEEALNAVGIPVEEDAAPTE